MSATTESDNKPLTTWCLTRVGNVLDSACGSTLYRVLTVGTQILDKNKGVKWLSGDRDDNASDAEWTQKDSTHAST
ncbi:MAG: hypothetical protein M1482_04945 [Chloroflexi bacterium]|nr:hypothetical protein [Chloroflexota bacterium]